MKNLRMLHKGISLDKLFWSRVQETNQTVHPEVISEMEHEGRVSPVEGAHWLVTLNRIGLGGYRRGLLRNFCPEQLGTCVEEINGDGASGILFSRFGLRFQLDIHEKLSGGSPRAGERCSHRQGLASVSRAEFIR